MNYFKLLLFFLGIGIISFFVWRGFQCQCAYFRNALNMSFDGVLVKKWEERGLNLKIKTPSDGEKNLHGFNLDGKMDFAKIGDTLIKHSGKNICIIKASKGSTIEVPFIFDYNNCIEKCNCSK